MSEPNPGDIASFVPAGYDSDDSDDEFLMTSHDSNASFGSAGSGRHFEDERIKIVPHIGWHAGLGERDFEISLDENIATWFEGFRESFKTFKKGPLITQRLQMFYLNTQNPFEWALKLFANCSDNNAPKSNSLAYTVMEEMANFKKKYNVGTDGLVDDNLRMVAFNFVAKQGHCLLFRMVAETFELLACREMFIPKVREMIARKQYKEAGQVAIDLELFDDFDEHDFVMPLFLQDKISIAEDYLNRAVRLQRPVVKLIDSFFDKKQSVESHCSWYITEHNVTDVYFSKLHQKPLSKLVQRLAKNYNVPKEFTPNVNKMKNFGALQFLLHKRYYEKSLNKDSWDEMVRDTVPMADTDLQLELICLCSNFNDQAEAAKWAKYFQIKLKDLPLLVQDYIAENDGKNAKALKNTADDEQWDAQSSEAMHTLSLDCRHVHLVDSREKFYAMISDLRQQSLVAFDSEWKPTFGGSNEVSLIQLATWDDVYLIDVMMSQLEGSDWVVLAKHVFNRDDILKLAFAPSTDISMFQKALPAFNVVYNSQNSSGILDLQDLWRHVDTIKNFRFPFEEEVGSQNLANLTKLCIGRKLDKSNQFSNWAQRPLRKEQLQYAALDAYCLLEIYDVIRKELAKLQLDPSEILNNVFYESKSGEGGTGKKRSTKSKASRRSRRNGGTEEKYNKRTSHDAGSSFSQGTGTHLNRNNASFDQQSGPNAKSVFVSEVHFVCDKMLEGLAKMLRRFGIDTVAIKSGENADQCVFVALQEQRFVLTRGSNFYKFAEHLQPGHCYKIGNDRVEDQLLEVLRYYRVIVRQENIFSRCQLCNCGRFLSASPGDIHFLLHGTEMPKSFRSDNRSKPELETDSQRIKLDRSWILETLSEEARLSGRTGSGAKIDTSYVGDTVLANVDVFFICDGCGRCYWDGSHLDNILAGKLADLLTLRYD
ncbi:exonuclease mut-7 homolog [Topomyia yanbarensis]|uniref:exonuclease mut-7 homolog n=1 Tax=Topomyia yanbarensis TaxID=2498891 RepID=UPI00273C5EC9|nr:exonuclease mut-7 homolog [Topomyia yanbarensis]